MDIFKDLFEKIRKGLNLSVTTGLIVLTIAGLIFLFRPGAALTLICRLIGIVLLVYGIRMVVRALSERAERGKTGGVLSVVIGVIILIIGLFIARNPVSLVNIAALLLGVVLLLAGIFWFLLLYRRKEERTFSRKLCMCCAAALAVIGVLMLFSPFAASVFVLRLIGIAFLFAAASGLLHHMKTRDYEREDVIDGTAEEVSEDR